MIVPAPGRDFDLVGLGQNSVDHMVRLASYPRQGDKLAALGYELLPGGQVATAVLAGQRLGLKCAYLGAVGDDHLSGIATHMLEEQGVSTKLRRVKGGQSQTATILVNAGGERTIIQHYDPRVVMRAGDLNQYRAVIQGARALHLDITDLPAAVTAARWAREAGALVALDIDRLMEGTEELFPLVDLLIGSESLAGELDCAGPDEALEALACSCGGVVGITLGEGGCMLLEPGARGPVKVPAFAVDAVDTTGCGDVFRAALMAALLRGQGTKLEDAARFAAGAAALQSRGLGAQSAVPDLEAVQSFLANDPPLRDM